LRKKTKSFAGNLKKSAGYFFLIASLAIFCLRIQAEENRTPPATPGTQTPTKETSTEQEKRAKTLASLKETIQFANATERRQAIRKVVDLKAEERGEFIPLLNACSTEDPDSTIREVCVRTLGDINVAESESFLIKALADSSPDVVRSAISALAKLNSAAAMPELQKLLEKEDLKSQTSLAAPIIRAMGKVGYRESAVFLFTKLKDSQTNLEVKSYIVLYMGQIKYIEAVDYLIELVKNEEEEIFLRSNAANSLGKIGEKKAIDPLKEQLAKIRSLGLRERSAVNRLKIQILGALVRLGDTRVSADIMAAARDDDANVRLRAVNQLAELKVAEARPLLDFLSRRDPSTQVKRAAKKAIDVLDGKSDSTEEEETPAAPNGRESPRTPGR